MNDLTDRLARLDHSAGTPADAIVTGDLARGHAALTRRRRTTAALAGVGLTLALGAGLGIAAVAAPHDPAAPPTAGRSSAPDLALVAYDGEQPQGFEVAVVPEGYFVQGSDPYVFTVAPQGDTSNPLDFEGKLVVTLDAPSGTAAPQQRVTRGGDGSIRIEDRRRLAGRLQGKADPHAPARRSEPTLDGTPVDVNGNPGAIRVNRDGLATTLEYLTDRGKVVVQMWHTVGLTDEQLVEFAEGITVTDEAQAGVG